MRAVIHTKYGPPEVLSLADVPQPTPAADEVLVEVHAAGLNRSDTGWRSGSPPIARWFTGWLRPRRQILGTEFSGVVTAAGAGVDRFTVGDRVFGVSVPGFGTHAEYCCIKQTGPIATMPEGMSFVDAAGVCDGMSLALGCLRRVELSAGERIVVYGSSGAIGTAAVQLAKWMGAHVTAVCTGKDLDLMRRLGADEVVDYTVTDFTRSGATYDVVFDAVGKHSYFKSRRVLAPRGRFASTDLGFMWMNPVLFLATKWLPIKKKAFLPVPPYRQANVELLKELWENGSYHAVIDRTYPLEDIVPATRFVESKQKVGNVVLTVRG